MLIVVQLSDLHFKSSTADSEKMANIILNAIHGEASPNDKVILICTGDISQSGRKSEYDSASLFFTCLLTNIHSTTQIFFCPGNHDNYFSGDIGLRSSAIKDIMHTQAATPSQIAVCLSAQDNYNNFVSYFNTPTKYTLHPLASQYKISADGKDIQITTLNTAWICELHSSEGSVFFPNDLLNSSIDDNYYNIAIMHHTPNWFRSESQRLLRNFLSKFDLIFTGHEHEPADYSMSTQPYSFTNMIEGGIINGFSNESSFNILRVDYNNGSIENHVYRYDTDAGIFRICNRRELTLVNVCDNRINRILKSEFIQFLDTLGVSLSHPHKLYIKFNEIYVPPDLTILNGNIDKIDYHVSLSDKLNGELGKMAIYGDDKAGKTAAAKFIFRYQVLSGKIPVYIDCSRQPKSSFKSVVNLILGGYKAQYSSPDQDIFLQSQQKSVVPLLDNLEQAKLDLPALARFITDLDSRYDNYMIFTGAEYIFEKLREESEWRLKGSDLTIARLQPFGYRLRGRLIEKWLALGRDELEESEEYLLAYDDYMKLFERIISYNFVPPYPIYFLTALSGANLRIDTGAWAYGEYYQALAIMALTRANGPDDNLNTKLNFLAHLAYQMFLKNTTRLTQREFIDSIGAYNAKYEVDLSPHLGRQLEDAELLVNLDSCIRFKYKYMLYYFIARYLHDNLHGGEISIESIDSLITSMRLKSSSAILLILVSLGIDQNILERIATYSSNIFKDGEVATLNEHASFFGSLIDSAYKFTLPDISPKEARQHAENEKDTKESGCDSSFNTQEDKIIDHSSYLGDFMDSTQSAIRCVDIMGQIVKAHYGTLLPTQKDPLIKEGINLPLRALHEFYINMVDDITSWLEETEERLRNKDINRIIKFLKREIIIIISLISYFFLDLPVSAFASKNIKISLDKFFVNAPKTEAIDIIKFAIETEIDGKINFIHLQELVTSFKGKVLPYTVLQHFVIAYAYMHKLDHIQRSKLESILNISHSKLLMIAPRDKDK